MTSSSASTPWWADRFLAQRPSQSTATHSPEPLPPPTALSTDSRPDDGQSTMTGTSEAIGNYLESAYASSFYYGFLARNSSVIQSSDRNVTAVTAGATNDEGDVDFYVALASETKLSELFPTCFRIPDAEKDYLLAAGSLLVMELTATRGSVIVQGFESGLSTSTSQPSSPPAARRPGLCPTGSYTTAVARSCSVPNIPTGSSSDGGSQATPDQSKVFRKFEFFSNWLGGKLTPKNATKPLPRLGDSDTILLIYGGEYDPIDRRVDRLRKEAGLSIKVIPIWAPLYELRRWEVNEHHLSTSKGLHQVNTKIHDLETKVNRLESKINGLETKVDGLETKVDGLATKVDGLAAKVDGLEAKINNLVTTVYGLRAEIRGVHSAVEEIRLILSTAMRPTTPNNGDAAPSAASAIGPSSSTVPASGVGPAAPPPSSPLSSLQPYTSVMPGFGTSTAPHFFSFVHPTTPAAHPHQLVVPNMMQFLPVTSVPMFGSHQPAGGVPPASLPCGYSFEAPAGALLATRGGQAPSVYFGASGRSSSVHSYSFTGGGGFGGAGWTYQLSTGQQQQQQQQSYWPAALPGGGGYFHGIGGRMMWTPGQPGLGIPGCPEVDIILPPMPFWVPRPQPQPQQSAALSTTPFSLESSAQFYGLYQPAEYPNLFNGSAGATQTAAGGGAPSFQVGARESDTAPSYSSSTDGSDIQYGTGQHQHQQQQQ
ncbi:hypothetical protein HK405_004279 [Cladochytrium tenue]|nr:hypothetical protein HK405_004279 [Cladochytrium tenue]